MPATQRIEDHPGGRRAGPLVAWGLLAGGALFFVGGSLHPKQDPPDVTVKEHLRVMFEDPGWYPSHSLLLVGTALIAAALVALARGDGLVDVRRARTACVVAATVAVLATIGSALHLVAASELDAIAAGDSTPLIDVQNVVETITAPAFGLTLAALALIGATTGILGNRAIAVFAVIGGVGYALAAATFMFTDRLGFLFPAASGIGLWAIAVGIGLVGRVRVGRPASRAA